MTSKSLWMDIDVAPDAGVLDGAQECDVAVIGSGIAGISTAYAPFGRCGTISAGTSAQVKSEKLSVSKSRPLRPTKLTTVRGIATSLLGQEAKLTRRHVKKQSMPRNWPAPNCTSG